MAARCMASGAWLLSDLLIKAPRRAGSQPAGNRKEATLRIASFAQRYRRRLPRMPRTIARPSELATLRAADFIAASTTVSRW